MSLLPFVAFSMRRLRVDLRDRLRVVAALRSAGPNGNVTLEATVNDVLERGLALVEAELLPGKLPKEPAK